MYGRCHIPLPHLAHVTYNKKKISSPPPPPPPHFESSVSAPEIGFEEIMKSLAAEIFLIHKPHVLQ